MRKKNKTISHTYVGLFQSPDEADTVVLDELMRKFQSGKRFLRKRILEGMNRKEAVVVAKPLFLPNSRYMRDAFLEAEASISSQKELLPLYVLQTQNKLQKLKQRIQILQQHMLKYETKQTIVEQHIGRMQAKVKRLVKQLAYYQHHIHNDTIPKMVDGSKKRLRLLNHGKVSIEEWKDSRSNSLYSRGEKSKGGNENTKLTYIGDRTFELAILNPLSTKRNDRLKFTVQFPEKFVCDLITYLSTGEAYSVRIKRRQGRYEVHVTLERAILTKPNVRQGVAGMDINPDNLSVTIVYSNGNFRASKVFWMHDVNTVRSDKRSWIIQQTLYNVMRWIQSFDIDTLVIEALTFLQSSGSKSFNRMSHNFSYSTIIHSLLSIANKENIALFQVNAHYSSLIGRVKYQQSYGLSVHQSAAFVLARRGLGYVEKVPRELVSVLFTKEVKKGQQISELFKHWKKIKQWYDEAVKEMRHIGISTKGLLFQDVLNYKTIEVPL